MENVQEVRAQGYLRLNEERRESARKLRRILFWGVATYAVAVGLVVWFAMGVMR